MIQRAPNLPVVQSLDTTSLQPLPTSLMDYRRPNSQPLPSKILDPSTPPVKLHPAYTNVAQDLMELIPRVSSSERRSSQRSFLLKGSEGLRAGLVERLARISTMWIAQNSYWLRFVAFVVLGIIGVVFLGPMLGVIAL